MQIYWLFMTGLLLFPWSLVLAPALTKAYRRISSGSGRGVGAKYLLWISLVLLTVLGGATLAFAAEPVATPLERLHDGVRDLTTGWTKVFRVIDVETIERGPIVGFFTGSIEGAHQALRQTTEDAYETATFFLQVPRPQAAPSEPGSLFEVRF